MAHRDWLTTVTPFMRQWLSEQPLANQRVIPPLEHLCRFGGSLRRALREDPELHHWQPAPGTEQEAFEDLTSKEYRPFLQEWFGKLAPGEMNDFSETLRCFFERAVGESLRPATFDQPTETRAPVALAG